MVVCVGIIPFSEELDRSPWWSEISNNGQILQEADNEGLNNQVGYRV